MFPINKSEKTKEEKIDIGHKKKIDIGSKITLSYVSLKQFSQLS